MKIAFLASTALVLTSVAAPAFAAPMASTATQMQGVCQANLRPNDNSKFTTSPKDETETGRSGEVEVSRSQTSRVLSNPGVTTTSTETLFGTPARNGGSPNLFADTLIKTTSTTAGREETVVYEVTYTQDVSYSYGCLVSKTTPQGRTSVPPGLQTAGLSITETITFKRDVTVVEPMADLVASSEVPGGSKMVCNNPGNNGGSWVNHNDYTGDCAAVAATIDWSDLNSNSGADGVGGNDNGGTGGSGNKPDKKD